MGASGLTVSRRFFISGTQRERTWTVRRECSTLEVGGRSIVTHGSLGQSVHGWLLAPQRIPCDRSAVQAVLPG
jgi:hypothetical protein